jgi:hypothetical protein
MGTPFLKIPAYKTVFSYPADWAVKNTKMSPSKILPMGKM